MYDFFQPAFIASKRQVVIFISKSLTSHAEENGVVTLHRICMTCTQIQLLMQYYLHSFSALNQGYNFLLYIVYIILNFNIFKQNLTFCFHLQNSTFKCLYHFAYCAHLWKFCPFDATVWKFEYYLYRYNPKK